MYKSKKKSGQQSMFFTLEESLNPRHPLYILANSIDWAFFENSFISLYSSQQGSPAKPIRLMVGLLLLKHLRNLSDESVVEQWSENNYYQYFCGEEEFRPCYPCAASELVHFRHRIGEEGCELILKESIRINGKDSDDDDVIADTTVQQKNITYPTDTKLHRKIIDKCLSIAEREHIELRQRYTRTLKKLSIDQRFRNHPKNKKKALKADKKVKTIAGRLVRELERKLPSVHPYLLDIQLFFDVLSQSKSDKNKIYSLHEPDVFCISKGKEHKKYEFGNKVSIFYTKTTGVIVGAKSFGNPYDGHTLEESLQQHESLTGKRAKRVWADRGYRGEKKIEETIIKTPKPLANNISRYKKDKERKSFRRRAAIEPVIGHLKSDHRLGRNFYKGIQGDSVNVLLAAAAFNLKRMINMWKTIFLSLFILRVKTLFMKTNNNYRTFILIKYHN